MISSIRIKLFAALLLTTLLVVLIMALIVQWGFDRGFLEYINKEEQAETVQLAERLEQYYAAHKSWEEIAADPFIVFTMHAEIDSSAGHRFKAVNSKKKHDEPRKDFKDKKDDRRRFSIDRTVILDETGKIIFGEKLQSTLPHMLPLQYEGKRIGSIGLYLPEKLSEANQVTFIERQTAFLVTAFLISLFIAVAVSIFLAFSLTRPIRRLSSAARKLTEGDYGVRVKAGSRDELARLSQDFNTLATTLEENEEQRKRWVSDIAHELRTPLTSLKGLIEALQDGIRKPDQRTYDTLHKGVSRLERLVEDLYDLNRSDIGTFTMVKHEVDFSSLVSNEAAIFQRQAEQAGLKLDLEITENNLRVYGDSERLQQLIANLLTNCVRYTDSGGKINLQLRSEHGAAVLEIADSAPGVPDEALLRLFNRLYRVDESRNRALGGSGLGLAICREIALAHDGKITAHHSELGGVSIIFSIPLHTDTSL